MRCRLGEFLSTLARLLSLLKKKKKNPRHPWCNSSVLPPLTLPCARVQVDMSRAMPDLPPSRCASAQAVDRDDMTAQPI